MGIGLCCAILPQRNSYKKNIKKRKKKERDIKPEKNERERNKSCILWYSHAGYISKIHYHHNHHHDICINQEDKNTTKFSQPLLEPGSGLETMPKPIHRFLHWFGHGSSEAEQGESCEILAVVWQAISRTEVVLMELFVFFFLLGLRRKIREGISLCFEFPSRLFEKKIVWGFI